MSTISTHSYPTSTQTTQGITNRSNPSTSSWRNRLREFFAPSTLQKAAAGTATVVVLGLCGFSPILTTGLIVLLNKRNRVFTLCASGASALLQGAEATQVLRMEQLHKCDSIAGTEKCQKTLYRMILNTTKDASCNNTFLAFSTTTEDIANTTNLFPIRYQAKSPSRFIIALQTSAKSWKTAVEALGREAFCNGGVEPCGAEVVPWDISRLSCAPEILDTSVGKCLCDALEAAKASLTTALTTVQQTTETIHATTAAWVYQVTTKGMEEGGEGIGWVVLDLVMGFVLGAITLFGALRIHKYCRQRVQTVDKTKECKHLTITHF